MRIALGIVSLSEQGGLQRDCLGLADALRARGHEVEVFAARFAPPWSDAHRAEILSTPIKGRKTSGIKTDPSSN